MMLHGTNAPVLRIPRMDASRIIGQSMQHKFRGEKIINCIAEAVNGPSVRGDIARFKLRANLVCVCCVRVHARASVEKTST